MGKYQPFNDLPAAQFQALVTDIEARGVILPIIVDENDKTIDGHQRRRAAAEAGVECPKVVVEGLSEDEKQTLALTLNLFRRHLAGVERAKALQQLANLGMSTRRMADVLGVSKSTVHRDLADVERPETVTDSLGRQQPSTKPERDVSQMGHVAEPPAGVDPKTGEITDEEAFEDLVAGLEESFDRAASGERVRDASQGTRSPSESSEERDAREAEEARLDRNLYFGRHLIGLWALLGDGNKPIDDLIEGWVPEECPAWLVEAHRPVFTPDGMRDLARTIEKLAAKWEAADV